MADKPPPPGFGDFEKQDEKPRRRSIFADLMEDDLTDAKPDLPSAPVSDGVVDPQLDEPAEPDQPDLFLTDVPSAPVVDRTEHIDAGESAAAHGDLSPPGIEGVEKPEETKRQRDEEAAKPALGGNGAAPPNDSAADRFAGDGVNSPPSLAEVASWRARVADAGYRPLAVYGVEHGRCFCGRPAGKCKPGKHPHGFDWEGRARANPPEAAEAPVNPKSPNTGLLCDGLRPLDLDIDDPELVARVRALAVEKFGPTILRWRPGSGRCLALYRAAEGEPGKRVLAGKLGKIEVLGHGQQFVAFGMHESGARLQWSPESPMETPVGDLPAVTEDQITAFLTSAVALIEAEMPGGNDAGAHATSGSGQQGEFFEVVQALAQIPNSGPPDWEHWNRVGMATWAATAGSAGGFDAWCAWSKRHPSFDPAAAAERWENYFRSPPTRIGAGTLIHLAHEARSTERNPPPATSQADYGGVEGANAEAAEAVKADAATKQAEPNNVKQGRKTKAASQRPGGWQSHLLRNRDGAPRAVIANVLTTFREAPEWRDLLWFDTFHLRPVLRGRAPWMLDPGDEVWTANHDVLATNWLQHHQVFVKPDAVRPAVDTIALEHRFHPVLDYLNRCQWDGEARLDDWAVKYLGVAPSEYAQAVASRWMIAAVARVTKPGCKADCCLILEGPQGILKSTALKVIAQPWFTDEIAALGSKDAALQLPGAWVIELSELDAMSRSEVARVKAFMSRTSDRYRPPYGHRVIDVPRQSVFAGTVNKDQYLRDETGGRRLWPLACGKIDIDGLTKARDQLWAEARVRYAEGKPWWLDQVQLVTSAQDEQEARYEDDPWEEEIAKYAKPRAKNGVSIVEILRDGLDVPSEKQDQRASNRVARCLIRLGWERRQLREDGRRHWRYWPKEEKQWALGFPAAKLSVRN